MELNNIHFCVCCKKLLCKDIHNLLHFKDKRFPIYLHINDKKHIKLDITELNKLNIYQGYTNLLNIEWNKNDKKWDLLNHSVDNIKSTLNFQYIIIKVSVYENELRITLYNEFEFLKFKLPIEIQKKIKRNLLTSFSLSFKTEKRPEFKIIEYPNSLYNQSLNTLIYEFK